MPINRNESLLRRTERTDLGAEYGQRADQNPRTGVLRSLRGVPSRRDVLHGLAAGLGFGFASVPLLVEAKPKRRKKRKRLKPVKPNAYGCLEVNDPCRRHTQCCSGICTGKPGRKRCRAHGTGTCGQSGPGVCTADNPELLHCNGDRDCFCVRTTAGSNFCANWFGYLACSTCRKDTDCQALGFPAGSACVPVAVGHCTAAECATGMACIAPCGVEPPVMI